MKLEKSEIIAQAQTMGSTAKTIRPAVKYILTHRVKPSVWPPDLRGGDWRRSVSGQSVTARLVYQAAEAARKSMPQAKRASKDANFRRNFLRRLNAETSRLTAAPRTCAEVSAYVSARRSIEARLAVMAVERRIATGRQQSIVPLPKVTAAARCHTLSASWTTPEARLEGLSLSRCQWDVSTDYVTQIVVDVNSESRKGSRGWYTVTHADHRAMVRSFGLIDADARVLHVACGKKEWDVTLPDGMYWDIDQHGIRAVSGPDDFHPDIAALTGVESVGRITGYITKNTETRRAYAAQVAAEAAEMEGVYVCVADSRRAGNCLEGTLSFARNHGLDPACHYSAPEILRQANGDAGRVKITIRAAIMRHRKECEQGFALLEEHRIN